MRRQVGGHPREVQALGYPRQARGASPRKWQLGRGEQAPQLLLLLDLDLDLGLWGRSRGGRGSRLLLPSLLLLRRATWTRLQLTRSSRSRPSGHGQVAVATWKNEEEMP